MNIDSLIEALKIFKKYDKHNQPYPFHAEHDKLCVLIDAEPDKFSKEDLKALEKLGFFPTVEGHFMAFV